MALMEKAQLREFIKENNLKTTEDIQNALKEMFKSTLVFVNRKVDHLAIRKVDHLAIRKVDHLAIRKVDHLGVKK